MLRGSSLSLSTSWICVTVVIETRGDRIADVVTVACGDARSFGESFHVGDRADI